MAAPPPGGVFSFPLPTHAIILPPQISDRSKYSKYFETKLALIILAGPTVAGNGRYKDRIHIFLQPTLAVLVPRRVYYRRETTYPKLGS